MATEDTPHDPAIGDHNIERLLDAAYRSEVPSADFAHHLEQRLLVAAQKLGQARTASKRKPARGAGKSRRPTPSHPAPGPRPNYRSWAYGIASAVAGLVLLWHALDRKPGRRPAASGDVARHALPYDGLTARPRPRAPAARPLAVGTTLRTGATERQRRTLDDGSVLYVNANTVVRVAADRRVTLRQGEVYIEVAPRARGTRGATFVVQTAGRAVSALGTRFGVRVSAAGTGVVVTQGQVQVSGVPGVVAAGQEVPAGVSRRQPAPRASHVLGWARDLMTAAEARLVPASRHAGGALVVRDPDGRAATLSLRRFHIDVHIEDGFARTTIDQTYFNHTSWRREGTFYFPLPPDASLSRLAMYVDGELREGGMAERQHARSVFERIVATQRDPALLEWVDGSTFKMRVFPLEGRQEKRILLSYVQRLPVLYGTTRYRFPSGHSLAQVGRWSFHARVKGGARLRWSSASHDLTCRRDGRDLILEAIARDVQPDRDVTLNLHDEAQAAVAEGAARFAIGVEKDRDGTPAARYLMVRYRPRLAGPPQRQRRDWVFLCETSGERDPLLARAQVEVVRTLLANAEHDDTFCILAAGTRVRADAGGLRPATARNVRAGIAFLEQSHLIGALDLSRALEQAAELLRPARNPYLVHVGSGIAVLGERRLDKLAGLIPARVRYVGVGVGKRWARSFMKAAAGRTGGHVTRINPDEPITWRAFDLMATLNTPRLLDVKVEADTGKVTFLSDDTSLAQGEELCAIARLADDGSAMPRAVTVSGTLDGRPFRDRLTVAVRAGARPADYLPRCWARLEIERLLTEGAQQHQAKIIELSKRMYVMSPFTSLLVLENDAMHQQFGIDGGRSDHWAPYDCPRRIKVVSEPWEEEKGNAVPARKPTAAEVLKTIVVRVPPRLLNWGNQGPDPLAAKRYVTAFQLYSAAGAVPLARGHFGPNEADDPPSLKAEDIDDTEDPEVQPTEEEIKYDSKRPDKEKSAPGDMSADDPIGIEGDVDDKNTSISAPSGLGRGQSGLAANPDNRAIGGYNGGMGRTLRGTFYGRSGATKERALKAGGGNSASEAAVARGLIWIVKHQHRDGHWSIHDLGRCNCGGKGSTHDDIAGTAFGLLPLLGAGNTHKPGKDSPYHRNVLAGLRYLMRKQNRATGNFGGTLYSHGLATIALCEAYGLTQDRLLKASAQKAVNYIVYAQHNEGGWRYGPKQKGDTSVVGWQLMALKSAQMANLNVPPLVMKRAERYLDSVMDDRTYGYGYTGPGAAPTTTAIGLLWRLYLQGWGPANPKTAGGVNNVLKANMPGTTRNMYYFYHATQVLHHLDNQLWQQWNQKMRDELIKTQDRSATPRFAHQKGSWSPEGDAWGSVGGRLMTTSLALLTLEVYYRHLPLYRRDAEMIDKKNKDSSPVKRAPGAAEETNFDDDRNGGDGAHSELVADNDLLRRFAPDAKWAARRGSFPVRKGGDLWHRGPGPRAGGETPLTRADVDDWARQFLSGAGPTSLLYQRPSFSEDRRLFSDLTSYAPGLNTSRADILAVLEAEASPDPGKALGRVDPAARALIDRARQAGWQAVTIPADHGGRGAAQVVFDGAGRYVCRRLVSWGLRELIVCDGKNLWHLYPELAIGARRTVSRFHRRHLTALVPWALPPAEDLACGADVKRIGDRTVAVIPHAGRSTASRQLHLIFAADGRLVERRLIQMPSHKVLQRETYNRAGRTAARPDLKPDMSKLVIVPLPLRSREFILGRSLSSQDHDYGRLSAEAAIALIATDSFTRTDSVPHEVFGKRFHSRGDKRLGFYTLLAATGREIDSQPEFRWKQVAVRFNVIAEHPDEPLARYLAHQNRAAASRGKRKPAAIGGPAEGFVQRLAATRNLYLRWVSGEGSRASRTQRQRDLALVGRCQDPFRRWALLDEMQRNTADTDAPFQRALAGAYRALEDTPALAYAARYESARCFAAAGQTGRARQQFKELLTWAVRQSVLPQFGDTCYQLFQRDRQGRKEWAGLLDQTAAALVVAGKRPAVIGLAWQCHEFGDRTLAGRLYARACARVPASERRATALAGIQYLWSTRQYRPAERALRTLLQDRELAGRPLLWRLGAALARRCGRSDRVADCLDRALELEYQHSPRLLSLRAVRARYGDLLRRFQSLAVAGTRPGQETTAAFRARVVRAADRWRALDHDRTAACRVAAHIFQSLGDQDLAWEYYTTGLGLDSAEPFSWLKLAQTLAHQGSFLLADRAYAEAFRADPTNAELLGRRVVVLDRAGKPKQARRVCRHILQGQWPARFRFVFFEAQRYLDGE